MLPPATISPLQLMQKGNAGGLHSSDSAAKTTHLSPKFPAFRWTECCAQCIKLVKWLAGNNPTFH